MDEIDYQAWKQEQLGHPKLADEVRQFAKAAKELAGQYPEPASLTSHAKRIGYLTSLDDSDLLSPDELATLEKSRESVLAHSPNCVTAWALYAQLRDRPVGSRRTSSRRKYRIQLTRKNRRRRMIDEIRMWDEEDLIEAGIVLSPSVSSSDC